MANSPDFDPDVVFASWIQGDRSRQEDYYGTVRVDDANTATSRPDMLIVADGMGGHVGGDVASGLAVNSFIEAVLPRAHRTPAERLEDGLAAANRAIAEAIAERPEQSGMGCTLVAVDIREDAARWISVGDSPVWVLRGQDLTRLNADHSLAGLYAELVSRGEMTKEDAAARGGGNQLRSALTGAALELVDRYGLEHGAPLLAGDIVLLASDGILTLSEDEIVATLSKHRQSAKAAAEALTARVKAAKRPNQDNTTVLVYRHPGDATVTRAMMASRGTAAPNAGGPWRALALAAGAAAAVALLALALGVLGGPEKPSDPGAATPAPGNPPRTE